MTFWETLQINTFDEIMICTLLALSAMMVLILVRAK